MYLHEVDGGYSVLLRVSKSHSTSSNPVGVSSSGQVQHTLLRGSTGEVELFGWETTGVLIIVTGVGVVVATGGPKTHKLSIKTFHFNLWP